MSRDLNPAGHLQVIGSVQCEPDEPTAGLGLT